VKFSFRQILASTAGAVIAAIVASTFGVKGTIVGVAIGSAAATMGTALVAQSIERGHQAVKQVAVRVPETSTLLRKLGGTGTSGPSTSSVDASSAPTEVVGGPQPGSGADETIEMASTTVPAAETERLEISAATDAPATEHLQASTMPAPPGVVRTAVSRGFSWRAIAASAVIVFVLALLFITAVELISGKPLATIFGGADTGTTLKNLVNPSPAPSTTPTSTTSTTSATSATTTTTAGTATTTSTTEPSGGVTTTTSPSASTTTTTTGPQATTTTTTVSSSP
jgi:hypothetical protein